MAEILRRLPLKGLSQFHCVSKQFKQFITKQVLPLKHSTPLLLSTEDSDNLLIYKIDGNGHAKLHKTYQFDDGVFDPKFNNGYCCFESADSVFNLLDLHTGDKTTFRMPFQFIEFGFDSITQKIKLLVWSEHGMNPTNFTLYSLHESSKGRCLSCSSEIKHLGQSHCSWFDSIHWFIGENQEILTFNFTEEKFHTRKLPTTMPISQNNTLTKTIFTWENSLCVAVHQPSLAGKPKSCIQIHSIWFLTNAEKNRWIRLLENLTLQLDEETAFICYPTSRWVPREADAFARNGEINFLYSDKRGNCYLFEINMLTRDIRRTKITGLSINIGNLFQPYIATSEMIKDLLYCEEETESDEDIDANDIEADEENHFEVDGVEHNSISHGNVQPACLCIPLYHIHPYSPTVFLFLKFHDLLFGSNLFLFQDGLWTKGYYLKFFITHL